MKLAKGVLILIISLFAVEITQAQFWIGPRIGMHYTAYKYQEKPIPLLNGDLLGKNAPDSIRYEYDITNGKNFNTGIVFEYTTGSQYSVHGEAIYQIVSNKVSSQPGDPIIVSESTYKFISVPILLKYNFDIAPQVKFYLNFGPHISYWLSGKGKIKADELIEFGVENATKEYKVHFGESSQDLVGQNLFIIPKSNRLQYSFDLGAGVSYSINEFLRTYVDFRYSFGHSNMGFNDQTDFGLQDFKESIQYSHQITSFSIGFLVGYDPNNKRKGASTNRLGK